MKGIYQSKNKKKALINALSEVLLTCGTSKTQLFSVKKIELIRDNYLENNVIGFSMILFIGDFLHQVLKNEGQNKEIYFEITEFLNQVELQNKNAHLIFIIRFLNLQGILPLTSEGIFLSPEKGQFSSNLTHPKFNQEISELWKKIIIDDTYHHPIPRNERKNFLQSLMIYSQIHLPNFHTPKSLEVLEALFQ